MQQAVRLKLEGVAKTRAGGSNDSSNGSQAKREASDEKGRGTSAQG